MTFLGFSCLAQFTRQDSLRGSITPERSWWDLNYYHLDIRVDPNRKWIEGTNTIDFTTIEQDSILQIDLQPPLRMLSAVWKSETLKITQEGNAHFIHLSRSLKKGEKGSIRVAYAGHPKVAVRPPWDGGVTFQKDINGNHFVATSCQGLGASIWWPCKDHMYDEPDSMLMSITVPEDLVDVSNGLLRSVEQNDNQTKTYNWCVSNPINNYGVNINIGDYAHWTETYDGENGPLRIDYYPLRENEKRARKQWKDVPRTLEAFEHWFGPFPFYEDGYKLVEVPYLGMEHQSSITYGNGYQNGYSGRDLSGTGYGMLFDFIIVHESGHEWFANNITYKDMADMWIHESFTNYSESLFLEYHFGKKAANEYVLGTRANIRNDRPIIAPYDVNARGSGDMYSKGGNMLHTLRQLVEDDEKWRAMLRGLNKEFFHKTVTTREIEEYMAESLGLDLKAFFDQYLRDVRIPVLEYYHQNSQLFYRWNNVVRGFQMPVGVRINRKDFVLQPKATWQIMAYGNELREFDVDRNFYVRLHRLR